MDTLALVETADSIQEGLPPEVAGYEDPADPTVRGEWRIQNLASADFALQRLAECDAEAAAVDAQVEAAVQRLRARADQLKARAARGASFFTFKLTEYANANRAALLGKGKAKGRGFLHGRIGWRAKPERLVVKDAKALEAWLRELPRESPLARWKVEPVMKELQALVQASGEIPPGCDVEPETETLKIEALAPETALAREE